MQNINSGRVLALDIGSVRIGAAISDPSGIIAQGLGVWSAENFLDEFRACVEKYQPSLILVGLPNRTDGKKSDACENILRIISDLKTQFPALNFETWDERFTTVIAQRVLLEADVSRKKRREKIDKLAAVLILESWLENRKIL